MRNVRLGYFRLQDVLRRPPRGPRVLVQRGDLRELFEVLIAGDALREATLRLLRSHSHLRRDPPEYILRPLAEYARARGWLTDRPPTLQVTDPVLDAPDGTRVWVEMERHGGEWVPV